MDVALAGHNGLRAQIYMTTTGTNLDIDTAEVTQIASKNSSFERDYGWEIPGWWQRGCNPGAINWARYSDPFHPSKTGAWFLEANTSTAGASICEDMNAVPLPGQSYTFSIWLRSPTSQVAQGNVVLWALGGAQEIQATSFTLATTSWVQVTAPLDVVNSGHTGLRAEIYMNTTGRNYDFDGAEVYKNLLSNASFEMGTFSPWDRYETATNYAVYYSPSITHGGGWFAETNTSVPGGSIFQEVGIQPQPGESYTFTIWTRCASTCNVNGTLVLWGRTNDEAQGTNFNVNSAFWTPIVVPLDVKVGGHTSLRAQIYLGPGGTLRVDSTGNSASSGTPSGR